MNNAAEQVGSLSQDTYGRPETRAASSLGPAPAAPSFHDCFDTGNPLEKNYPARDHRSWQRSQDRDEVKS
jgi:hypothetical protein